jgi:LPS-assembly lipoprotein
MWSASRRALPVLLYLIAAACGFEPMYGEEHGAAVRNDLEGVRVALIANRAGQELRTYINQHIHGSDDETAPARYQLEITLVETRQFYGIQRDLSATYARFVLTGYYALREIKTQKVVLHGNTAAYSSYNIAADPFNSIVAENGARDSAVHGLGDDLVARVALYLRNPTPPSGG